jgi:hypothetical protein
VPLNMAKVNVKSWDFPLCTLYLIISSPDKVPPVFGRSPLTDSASTAANPIATHHLPFFITPPGETDVLYNVTLVFVVAAIVLTGVIFLTIHSLPERMAHKSRKVQMDLIAVLCLLALLLHLHVLWLVALILAFIDIPDFLTPVNRIASSVEAMAGPEVADSPSADHSEPTPSKPVPVKPPRQHRKGAAHA